MNEEKTQMAAGVASELNAELDALMTSNEKSYCAFTGKPIEQVFNDIACELANERALKTPDEARPVLAQIKWLNSLSTSSWYEVVYHDGENWAAYAGSDTFKNCEQVVQWRYVTDLMPSI